MYKEGQRKDCDILIYPRGAVKNEWSPVDWDGLITALEEIEVRIIKILPRVIKCRYRGKNLDLIDPTETGGYPEEDDD